MTEPTKLDMVLGFLRKLATYDGVSEEAREAAEECRQILLRLKRDRVPEERTNVVAERFIENWDTFEEDLMRYDDIVCSLDTFAVDGDAVEMDVHLAGDLP